MAPTELIVVLKNRTHVGQALQGAPAGLRLEPIFQDDRNPSERALRSQMDLYHHAMIDDPAEAEALAAQLLTSADVDGAYTKPPVELPYIEIEPVRPIQPRTEAGVPDFIPLQDYLAAAPVGIDTAAAWGRKGGKGADVHIIDVEGGWELAHVDLVERSLGLVDGVMINDPVFRHHGTAVFGEIGGDENGRGIVGISPDSPLGAVSHGGKGAAWAIHAAARHLRPGDIMLLEMHAPGPRYNYTTRKDQLGYIAMEWWSDCLLAIQAAVARGIIVVEAAGNGAEDFNDTFYDTPKPGFPSSWINPLGGKVDSGAILVGAGRPPRYGVDRSRFYYSNHGRRVDCQGWGAGVVTTGYGYLFKNAKDETNERYWYTDRFGGTSSASPIVTGAVACLQGIAKSQQPTRLLTPLQVREALRRTGSKQQASPDEPLSQNIGSRPDLKALRTFLQL